MKKRFIFVNRFYEPIRNRFINFVLCVNRFLNGQKGFMLKKGFMLRRGPIIECGSVLRQVPESWLVTSLNHRLATTQEPGGPDGQN